MNPPPFRQSDTRASVVNNQTYGDAAAIAGATRFAETFIVDSTKITPSSRCTPHPAEPGPRRLRPDVGTRFPTVSSRRSARSPSTVSPASP